MGIIKGNLRWEITTICVDHHAQDGLERGRLFGFYIGGKKTFLQMTRLWENRKS